MEELKSKGALKKSGGKKRKKGKAVVQTRNANHQAKLPDR